MEYDLGILKEEGYYGHVISEKLPKGLDNRLYTMLHLIGGMTTKDVAFFAEQATPEEIKELHRKVREFPSKVNEILPYAGAYKMLLDSPQYQEIINMVKFGTYEKEDVLQETGDKIDVGADGFVTTDTNPFFTNYIKPKVKQRLFKHWDSLGKSEYDSLKLFGVENEWGEAPPYGSDFHNVADVLYPVLALEWLGGVKNTKFAKAGWKTTSEMGFEGLKFKVEPIGYDYMFDESVNFGEQGYSCWDIRVIIDKDGDLGATYREYQTVADSDEPFIQSLFPESARNKVSSYRNYTEDQMELIEELWYHYEEEANEYFREFCRVEVVLV
tara:strand:+ start:9484 stop:10464 length:981 start_codon:yes stop_codon:yes gene_type:complete